MKPLIETAKAAAFVAGLYVLVEAAGMLIHG